MTKAIHAVLAIALACLFALSAALPSVLSQSVSAQTKTNVPRTLLGKPYRTPRDSQSRTPSRWTLVVTDRDDTDADHASAHAAQTENGSGTRTKMNMKPRAPIPLPLVINTFSESGPARLRLMRSKRPMQHSPCVDNVAPSKRAHSDGMNSRDEVEQLQSPDVSRPEKKQGLREVPVPVRRSKRLYNRGEWKSRLFEEY